MTVGHKILTGIAVVIAMGLLSMLATHGGIATIEQALRTLSELEEPASTAAYEMEINAIGTGMGVLKYLETGDETYRRWVAKDATDFERFLAQYQKLANTLEEKALAQKIGRLFREYRAVGETLITENDQQDELFAAVSDSFERAHAAIDKIIQANLAKQRGEGFRKTARAMAMNTEVAAMGSWLGSYLRTEKPKYRARIASHVEQFRQEMAHFHGLAPGDEEKQLLIEIETLIQEAETLTINILSVNDVLRANISRFLELRAVIDEVLDEQIQAEGRRDLDAAKEIADQAAVSVLRTVGVFILVFILLGLTAAVLLFRTVNGPLQALKNGTKAVSTGELSHRLRVKGTDEFAELTASFNQMVAELEATTVSKQRLEESQQELQRLNAQLQDEINQRKHTEKNLQVLSRQLLKAQEEERRRIACELHDEIGQALSAIKINLETVELRPESAARLSERLRDTIGLAESTLQQVRSISLDLRPSLLDDLGLAAALRWHLDQQAQRTGFIGQFIGDRGNSELDPQIKVTCFRIAQEALTNVVRHAQAQHVIVELRRAHRTLKLSVRDDGIGFDLGKARKSAVLGASIGVLGMQERAVLAGGQLDIDSAPGRGTDVRVTLPLS